jgi:cyclopropane-fatty-acyl-phospholipid synthase
MAAKDAISELVSPAGVTINGTKPYDITVHNEEFYSRVLSQGNMGAGESYMDGWWDCEALDECYHKLLKAEIEKKVRPIRLLPHVIKSRVLNMQTKRLSKDVAEQHYDAGNDLYQVMLDKNMQYTCGYWKNAKNLDQAQVDKLHLICKKLGLKKGMTVLELGGGFGGLARFMAKEYGCIVTSYNISKEQVAFARAWCKGLPVTFVEDDYRNATGVFDRVVSIGLMEHVGHKNYRNFFELANRCLKDDGLFLLHTIASNKTVTQTDPWIDKYIFPHGHLPSIKQLGGAMEKLFVMEDWHNFGADYDKTLMAWWQNFSKGYAKLDKNKYDQRFYRMWRYYLLTCAGGFRARKMQLWQLVLSKHGVPGGYQRIS